MPNLAHHVITLALTNHIRELSHAVCVTLAGIPPVAELSPDGLLEVISAIEICQAFVKDYDKQLKAQPYCDYDPAMKSIMDCLAHDTEQLSKNLDDAHSLLDEVVEMAAVAATVPQYRNIWPANNTVH